MGGCMGISLSRGGRCAMWMKELPTYEHAVFGSGHAGENWSSDMKLTTVNDDDRWHCAIMMCDREREGCEGDMMEMKRKMEMMEENQDFLHRMFEDCLVRDLEVTECHDEANWVDNQGRDCAFYELADMCEFNNLEIFAVEGGSDAKTACCACGGGDAEYAAGRRSLTFGETCKDMSVEDEAECLRNRVNVLEDTINNVGL